MSIFKRKLTIEDIAKAFNEMPAEDKEKVLNLISTAPQTVSEETVETTTESVEATEESNTQPESEEKAELETETTTETVEAETKNEEPEATEETVEETTTTETQEVVEQSGAAEETPQEQANDKELQEAQNAKFLEFSERLAKVESYLANLEEKGKNADFGLSPHAPEAKQEDTTRRDAVLRGYAGRDAYKYQ